MGGNTIQGANPNIAMGGAAAEQAEQPGAIGGQDVTENLGTKIKQAFTDLGHKITSFFKGIGDKYTAWREARAEARQQARQDGAAETIKTSARVLLTDLAANQPTMRSYAALQNMVNQARIANPDNPAEGLRAIMDTAVGDMDFADVHKMVKTNFTEFAARLEAVFRNEHRNDARIQESLNASGIGGDVDPQVIVDANEAYVGKMNDAMGMMKAAVSDRILNEFRGRTDAIFEIGDDGSVSSTMYNSRVTNPATGGHFGALERVNQTAQNFLEKAENEGATCTLGGVELCSKAEGDWHRMNINFVRRDGQVVGTKSEGADQIETRQAQGGQALRDIAGSDVGAKVVSSVLHQYGWRDIVHTFASQTGRDQDLRPVPSGYDAATAKTADGDEIFANPGQVGDAQFTVSRTESGDIQINVDWTYLSASVGRDKLAIHPDNPTHVASSDNEDASIEALKVRMQTSFTISGADAAEGNLVINDDWSMRHDFSGTIALPQ